MYNFSVEVKGDASSFFKTFGPCKLLEGYSCMQVTQRHETPLQPRAANIAWENGVRSYVTDYNLRLIVKYYMFDFLFWGPILQVTKELRIQRRQQLR
jgi:hypothetical protein